MEVNIAQNEGYELGRQIEYFGIFQDDIPEAQIGIHIKLFDVMILSYSNRYKCKVLVWVQELHYTINDHGFVGKEFGICSEKWLQKLMYC